MEISKEDVLAKLQKLPSMPAVLQEIIASFKNEDIDNITLANMISQDQGLSAKVLRVANSPFYGLPRSISSMQDAILVMGFNSVRTLVLSAGFVKAFSATSGSSFDRLAYWKRSFRVAGYARALAQLLQQDQAMVFTAAMFHEIGLLVLDVCIPGEFSLILQQQKAGGNNLTGIEQELLGFDHYLIGAELARIWNFPAEIENAIRYWAFPDHELYNVPCGIVYVAVLLESGVRGDELILQLPDIFSKNKSLKWMDIEAGLPDAEELEAGAAMLVA